MLKKKKMKETEKFIIVGKADEHLRVLWITGHISNSKLSFIF